MAIPITPDVYVLSKLHTPKKPKNGANDSIMSSIATVRQTHEEVLRLSESTQKAPLDRVDLAPTLLIQKVAFDNTCKFLLFTAAKSRQHVDNMLEDFNHPVWTDLMANGNLEKMMGRFYELCLRSLKHYRNALNEISSALRSSLWLKQWQATGKHLFRRKRRLPRFGIAEDLPKLIQNSRNYNDLFYTLIRQAVPSPSRHIARSLSADGLCHSHPIEAARKSYGHIRCIQRALQIFYDTLTMAWTCHERGPHGVSISLKFDDAKHGVMTRDRGICFRVAVTTPHYHRLYLVLVVLVSGKFCACQHMEGSRVPTKTYEGKNFVDSKAKPNDAEERLGRVQHGRTDGPIRPASVQRRMRDLGLEEDLCLYLRTSYAKIESAKAAEGFCLGRLEMVNQLDCLSLYAPKGCYQRKIPYSLDDVLAHANKECRILSIENRIRIASFLAAEVLHLRASSWLPGEWSSKDIHFYDMDESHEGSVLGEPFLQTQLDISFTRHPFSGRTESDATRSSLRSLGLVLCEVAFSAPWRKLQLQEDVTIDLCEEERNFLNLMRLSETVSRELGSRYAKVVQTCFCEGFGAKRWNSPSKAELERVIIEDVVKELDECLTAVSDN